ncbi:Chaperone SurA [bioreactor metagenome]|uniref:Chaperone SurA n=1 Tax=bioreactor metagenome TaxID=1076179 RepID=A0A645ESU9_9ZZZZ
MMPAQVEVYHIVKYIVPDSNAKSNTMLLAKKVRDSLMAGGDFAEFAKKYSGDYGSAQHGGELGWVAKGKFVAEFEKAAYALQVNEISMPVESMFGYHVIKVIQKTKDSINAAHILFKLIQSEDDVAKAKIFLDSLKQIAIKNNNFSQLATEFSEDKETKGFAGLIGKAAISEIPLAFSSTVAELKDGEISEPKIYSKDPTKQGMHIVWRKRTIPEHKPTIKEDYEYLKKVATNFKIMELREKWIAELKTSIYWEIFD